MLNITVFVKDRDYIGVRSEGHAEYDDPGKDIVCAAVSTLMINTLNSIESFTEDDFEGGEDDGFLEFMLEGRISDESKLLMKSLVLGLTSVQESYGNAYLEITTKEV